MDGDDFYKNQIKDLLDLTITNYDICTLAKVWIFSIGSLLIFDFLASNRKFFKIKLLGLHKSKEAAPFQKISLTQIFRFYNKKMQDF